tara:strand:+ start:9071 stop:10531 length:1461 start_codon:yes stop_codon:yes gene_type:complete
MKSIATGLFSLLTFAALSLGGEIMVLSGPTHDDEANTISIDFRLWDPEAINPTLMDSKAVTVKKDSIKALSGDAEVAVKSYLPFVEVEGVSSDIALLIDLSAPEAAIFKKRNDWEITHAKRMMTPASPVHKFGVFTIEADTLTTVAELGQNSGFAIRELEKHKAKGKTTQIFQLTRELIAKLAKSDADRKHLIIFSDGEYEDQGELVDLVAEVEKQAKKAGVVISALGYAQNEKDKSQFLQSLRRMVEPTKGLYKRAEYGTYKLPEDFDKEVFYPFAESGGRLVLDASALSGNSKVTIEIETEKGDKIKREIEVKSSSGAVGATGGDDPNGGEATDNTVLYIIIAAVAVAIVILALLLRKLSGGNDVDPVISGEATEIYDDIPVAPQFSNHVYGWLEMLDADGSQEQITITNMRIGRGNDNDLVLRNDSVSNSHCVINQSRDGSWSVTDLDSGNGIYVNGKRVEQSALRDGDTLELGEVKMRFRVN